MRLSTYYKASLCLAVLVSASSIPVVAISAPIYLANSIIKVRDKQTPPDEYYVNVPISGGSNTYIGHFEMCVRIFQSHGRKYVSYWNYMGSGQYLVVSVAPLHKLPSGELKFEFKENGGVGSIKFPDSQHVRVETKAAKPSNDRFERNVLRQYGVNVLPKALCPADRNPETFGGGHAALPPEH